jgi:hypothetical protein
MDPLTLFLAKLIGAICIVMAAAMLSRGETFIRTARSMVADPRFVMLGGAIRVCAGLAMMIGHDIWTGGALPIAVTLFGWLLFFSGVFLLFGAPAQVVRMVDDMKLETRLPAYALGLGLFGLVFLVAGYVG